MSSVREEANTSVPDTQETYYASVNENFKITSETQNASLNESQDFQLIDSEGDESIVEKAEQNGEANLQKSIDQTASQQIPAASQTEENNTITVNEKDETVVTDEKIKESEVEKITENVELYESEKKDELFDEDEIVQGTPPQNYSPSKKVGSVDITSLKRKASAVDELPAKIPRTMSVEDVANIGKEKSHRLEEESHQSYASDDSYQDLFKNINKDVVIEETQDPSNLEFAQNTLKIPVEHTADTITDDKARERINQQDKVFSEKYDVEKDESLNVSTKLTDVSDNDSTAVNLNSTRENDFLLEDDNLSMEKRDVTSTSVEIASEKSGIGTSDGTKSTKGTKTVSDEHNPMGQSNCVKPAEKTVDNNDKDILLSQTKSRISIELICEKPNVNRTIDRAKPKIVQIDDDGEKILNSSTEIIYDRLSTKTKPEVVQIDDSHEDGEKIVDLEKSSNIQMLDKTSYESKSSTDFSYKESMKESSLDSKLMDKKLVNGSTESKKSDTDVTLSLDSDTFSRCEEQFLSTTEMKKVDSNSFTSKDVDSIELVSISDNETSNVKEKNKSGLICNKTVQVEREIAVYVKFKCLMHMDEGTKEPVRKELTGVQCELATLESGRQKNEEGSLTDISDNKDSSPGSVNSNPQLYQLPSRLSIMSSSSSGSSAASFAIKLAQKSGAHYFPMPIGPAKHTKKSSPDIFADKQMLNETYDRLTHEWKNHRLLTTTILNFINTEVGSTATTATIVDTFANVSNERMDDNHQLEKNNMRSSTPSDHPTNLKMELIATPKSTKKSKTVKRPRSKLARSNAAQINGENGVDSIPNESALHTSTMESDTPSKKKMESTEDKKPMIGNVPAKSPRSVLVDELIGKNVFAKWSDNTYYLGMVSDRQKAKYKVNFYDGKSKTLIPEFVIPIPKILREGLSVYATTKTNDYGSCGIIIDVETSSNGDTYYTVETDEGEKLRVPIQNISLSADQAQVLKEEMDSTDKGSLPSTPKALGQVTLDNVVDGKRRSKRIGTPLFSTPKSRSNASGTSTSTSKIQSEPSGSGMSVKLKKEKAELSDGMSSDSNVDSIRNQTEDEYALMGIQKEIIGTPYEQIAKGPQSKIKSKSRSKKKEDSEIVATLGPIPTNSNIFKGMSFILTCASLETLERYQSFASSTETEATETEETDNEADWDRHFVRERLHTQIVEGGGKVYEDFEEIPKDEYENTMLITNVPNTTAKSILCLSAGIPVCNHKWIIRCCAEEKIVNKAEHILPNGWSWQKKAYIEADDICNRKPLSKTVVIIPNLSSENLPQFATFWRQVCQNAGAKVLIVEDSDAMETTNIDSDVVVVSNLRCPLWAKNSAIQLQIPVLSTRWVIQCIIEGKRCSQEPRYII